MKERKKKLETKITIIHKNVIGMYHITAQKHLIEIENSQFT